MGMALRILVFALGALLLRELWRVAGPRRVFTVRLRRGEPRAVEGTVTPAFLAFVREVAADEGVRSGRISGVVRDPGIALEFSRGFPAPARQRLRNWWGISGWKAAKPGIPRR